MLFDTTVCSVLDYGLEVWGFDAKESVTKIHLRAARSFQGLPKLATSDAVHSEICWQEPVYRKQVRMVRQLFRIMKMKDDRLAKRIYAWDMLVTDHHHIQTWSSEVRDVLLNHNQGSVMEPVVNFCPQSVITDLKESMLVKQALDH